MLLNISEYKYYKEPMLLDISTYKYYLPGTYISTGLQYVKLPSLKTRSLNPIYQASSARNQFKIQ